MSTECKKCGWIKGTDDHCRNCEKIRIDKIYKGKPTKIWDGVTPLYSWKTDKYYFSNVYEKIEDFGTFESMQFFICEKMEWNNLDVDYFADCIPDDCENDKLIELVERFNRDLSKVDTNCWYPGEFRAIWKG